MLVPLAQLIQLSQKLGVLRLSKTGKLDRQGWHWQGVLALRDGLELGFTGSVILLQAAELHFVRFVSLGALSMLLLKLQRTGLRNSWTARDGSSPSQAPVQVSPRLSFSPS